MADLDGPPNISAFLATVGISRSRLTQLRAEGVVTGDTLRAWIQAYCAHLRAGASGRHGDAGLELSRERALLAQAQRRRIEREETVAKGEYVVKAEAIKSFQRAAMMFRDGMLSVPGRIASTLVMMTDERDIDRALTAALRAELERLADSAAAYRSDA